MTEKRARALHRAMWRWLAKHPGANKDEWPGWKIYKKNDAVKAVWLTNECFACHIANDVCLMCPIKDKAIICAEKGSLGRKYRYHLMCATSDSVEWADVCNRMADAWREIPEKIKEQEMSENKDCKAMGLVVDKTISNLKSHLDLLSALTTWQNAQKKAQDQNPAQPDDAKEGLPVKPWKATATVHDMRLIMPDGQEEILGAEQRPEAPKVEPKFKIGKWVCVWGFDKGYGYLASCLGNVYPVIASCLVHGRYVYLLECENDGIFLAPEHCLQAADNSKQTPEKPQLKPFDRVLVRNENGETWKCEIFSHQTVYCIRHFQCIGGRYVQCLPYDGNEALLGTTKSPENG